MSIWPGEWATVATGSGATRTWSCAPTLPEPESLQGGVSRHSYIKGDRFWYNHRRQRRRAAPNSGLCVGTLVAGTGSAARSVEVGSVFRDETADGTTGPEDPRFFNYRDRLWCVCNGPTKSDPGIRAMHLVDLDTNTSVPLTIRGAKCQKVEKNWTPIVVDEELLFVYCFQPLCLLKLESASSGICRPICGRPGRPVPGGCVRGGTPLIELRDGWYGGFGHIAICQLVDCLVYEAVSVLVNVRTKQTRLGPIVHLRRDSGMPEMFPGSEGLLGLVAGSLIRVVFPYLFERREDGEYTLAFTHQDVGDMRCTLSAVQLRALGWPT